MESIPIENKIKKALSGHEELEVWVYPVEDRPDLVAFMVIVGEEKK